MNACECGCGEDAGFYHYSNRPRGVVRGAPRRFVWGHTNRQQGPEYLPEDRGYETPCWIWQRGLTDQGYGRLERRGVRTAKAHRAIYQRANGPVPDDMPLDHLCRVRACVNPDHLEPVTVAENNRRGCRTVLGDDDVRVIRALSGTEDRKITAERYGVDPSWIGKIQRRAVRRDVPDTFVGLAAVA